MPVVAIQSPAILIGALRHDFSAPSLDCGHRADRLRPETTDQAIGIKAGLMRCLLQVML